MTSNLDSFPLGSSILQVEQFPGFAVPFLYHLSRLNDGMRINRKAVATVSFRPGLHRQSDFLRDLSNGIPARGDFNAGQKNTAQVGAIHLPHYVFTLASLVSAGADLLR